MKSHPKVIKIRLTHSCQPNMVKVQAGLELWAAYLAENIRKGKSRDET